MIDEAIDHLDSAAGPMSVHVEVRAAGALDEARLRTAVASALDRHPRARVRRVPPRLLRRRYDWEVAPAPEVDPLDVLITRDDAGLAAARSELQSRPLPADVSPPLRVRLVRHPAGDVVMLHLHHAAGDGLSALQLLRSIVDCYREGAGAAGAVVPLATPDQRTLRLPHDGGLGWHRRARAVAGELRRWAAPSGRLAPDGGASGPGYGFHQVALTREQTRAVVLGRPPGTTVNDVLIAALHLAIEAWNRDHGVPVDRIGVLVPVNLRRPELDADVMGNLSFPVVVSTRPSGRHSPLVAVRAVAARTRHVKEGRHAAAPVPLLTRLQRLPVGLRRALARALARGPLAPTAILSNLGRIEPPLDFGAELGAASETWFSPPVKMPVGLAVGAVTAGDCLHLSFRYRHPLLGPPAAANLARRYLEALGDVTSAAIAERHPLLGPPAAAAFARRYLEGFVT